jgi:hypothetical protein
MAEPIRVDLEEAKQCEAKRMIKFLFAFCLSEDKEKVLVCSEGSLGQAFEKVKEIAKRNESESSKSPLMASLMEL